MKTFKELMNLHHLSFETFEEWIDWHKPLDHPRNKSSYKLHGLLQNPIALPELIANRAMTKRNSEYLLDAISTAFEIEELSYNVLVCIKMIEDLGLAQVISKFKNTQGIGSNDCFRHILENKELFQKLEEKKVLMNSDLQYLLNSLEDLSDLGESFGANPDLTKYVLRSFVFDKQLTEKLNRMIEENEAWNKEGICNIFDYIKYFVFHDRYSIKREKDEIDEELLKLNDMNQYLYEFEKPRRLEIVKILENNEVAQHRFNALMNAQIKLDFEALKTHLNKSQKKDLLNI